ncbi:uncharacterized protein LOC110846990 isoform X1 [Folsomia candida]|uniref:uncharacterized protein LOC110846990 isoform X1 n=2 Tax=Folsomia candida TaxID=158441 RepID=UPI001604C1C0|nr:uncharacterized protein LOC110846990 isoform X1 [Folsomia candida]
MNNSIAITTPPRVHFNPVVSQRRYCHHQYEEDYQANHHRDITPSLNRGEMPFDKNRNQNDMKNGTRVSETCSTQVEKVKKVLVTIVSHTPTSHHHHYGDNSRPTQTSSDSINQVSSTEDTHQTTNIPDLLKTTPLFSRKRAEEDNLIANQAEQNSFKNTYNVEEGKRDRNIVDGDKSSSSSSTFPPSSNHQLSPHSLSSLLPWGAWRKTGLLQQLSLLKQFVSKKKAGISSRVHHPHQSASQQEYNLPKPNNNNNTALFGLANDNSKRQHINSKNGQQGLHAKPEVTRSEDYPDEQGMRMLSPRSRSPSNQFKYTSKTGTMDLCEKKLCTDELSENVDKILEEIAGLEDMIGNTCEPVAVSTTPTRFKEQDATAEFVNECCSVSSALSCLTASANSLALVGSISLPPTAPPSFTGLTDPGIKKPPLPPAHKTKYLNSVLRNQFFGPAPGMHEPRGDRGTSRLGTTPLKSSHKLSHELESKLSEVKEELHRSREEISRFHPNLEEIDKSVRSSVAIDRFGRNPPNRTTSSNSSNSENSTNDHHHHSRYDEENLAKQCNWNAIVTQAKGKLLVSSQSNKFNNVGEFSPKKCTGILETDLDTGASREILKSDSHSWQSSEPAIPYSTRVSLRYLKSQPLSKFVQKQSTCSSMQNLNLGKSSTLTPAGTTVSNKEDRSRSMEFLLDDEKHAELMPPENALQKNQEREVSEHELRIQRSLQRLNVPDWYKNYATPTSACKTPNREFGSGTGLAGGWSGLSSSKTSSLTSLQSAGRYAGSKTGFSSTRPRVTTTSGRSSRESLMSPNSTASASPSPYFERSSFTYGMPYALSRFSTRMSCGASPASLSPSPSPVGGITSSTSTPVSSGPMSRYGYNKTPYLGWRSQERLNSKTLYRSPSERLAADLVSQQQKSTTPISTTASSDVSTVTSPRKETASDLSLNISDTSESSNKLNRVRSSIKAVSNAIVDYVNETKPLDEGINGRTSPRRRMVWLESSFVGTKPLDSPGTPDTTPSSVIMSHHHNLSGQGTTASYLHSKRSAMKLDHNGDNNKDTVKTSHESSQAFSSYLSRNEKTGECSEKTSPTLDDILDSLLALRRPHKKIMGSKGDNSQLPSSKDTTTTARISPPQPPFTSTFLTSFSPDANPYDNPPMSDWQQRMNQPLDDTICFPQEDVDPFTLPTTTPFTSNTTTTTRESTYHDHDATPTYMDALRDISATSATNPELGSSDYGATSPTTKYRPWLDDPTFGDRNEDEDEGKIAQEELNFGTPTEILPPGPTLVTNPLAGLNENSNPTTPARHRRVSFDLDVSDKDEKSSSRSKRDNEPVGGTIQCKNSKCGKSATGLEARREFKTCHNCNAYYCSRDCRRIHWEKHKKVCMQSRVGQLCKQIIGHCKEDSFVVSQLSTMARRGYLAKGRGCVKLFFSSPDRAERFLTGGLPELPEPWYIPHADMLPEEMGAPTFSDLSESCRMYNTETRFVLYVSVCVVNEVPTSGSVKWEREMVSRCSKIRLLIPRSFDESQPHHHAAIPAHLNPDDIDPRSFSPTHGPCPPPLLPSTTSDRGDGSGDEGGIVGTDNETLILRSVPTSESLKLNSDDRRRREISFTNIQKHLIERGVDLRRVYPDIYSKLCNYVENDEPFLPVTIYPRNSQTGGQFMCVIMPESSDTSYGLSSDPLRKVETINISE